jgi:hypothetical protein
MGFLRKWSGGLATPWDSSLDPVSLEEEIGAGAAEFLKGGRAKPNPRVKELERENQRLKDTVILLSQDLMLLKKRMNLV